MKKIFSLVLAILLAAALTVPASAHGHDHYALPDWAQADTTPTPGSPTYALPDWAEAEPDGSGYVCAPLARVSPEEWKAFFSSWSLQEKIVYPVYILFGN